MKGQEKQKLHKKTESQYLAISNILCAIFVKNHIDITVLLY